MQSPTIAPLRALAVATALVAGTGVAAAALVSPADDIEAQTVRFETASDATDQTPSTPDEDPAVPAPAPTPPPGTADAAVQTAAPGPVEETPMATAAAPRDGDGYTIDTVDDVAGRTPIAFSALLNDPPAAVADVVALLPDRAVLTAAVTQCIDELRTLVPDLLSNIDRDAGLRGLVQGMFDRVKDGAPVARPDSAANAEAIDVCVTSLRDVLPAPEELITVVDSLAGQVVLPAELTALVDQMRQWFDQMQQSDLLAGIDPLTALDDLRSLIPAGVGSGDSPVIGILDALRGRLAPAG